MNTKGFSDEQKQALIDLLILGMYSDGHLASAEDDRVKLMLDSLELPSDYSRQQFVDASCGRVNRGGQSEDAIRSSVAELSAKFSNPQQKRQALDALAELLASDSRVTLEENKFLILVEEAFA